jgi:hypothetical protein
MSFIIGRVYNINHLHWLEAFGSGMRYGRPSVHAAVVAVTCVYVKPSCNMVDFTHQWFTNVVSMVKLQIIRLFF